MMEVPRSRFTCFRNLRIWLEAMASRPMEGSSRKRIVLERTPHKLTVLVPKEEAGAALAAIMPWGPTDISVEEDEIGTVVERIYQEGAKGVAGNQK